MYGHPEERDVPRLLRQQAALAAFGSYAFREPVLSEILTEAHVFVPRAWVCPSAKSAGTARLKMIF